MSKLQDFENRLEQMISGVFARAFRSAVQPVEISAALQREVDNNAQILSRDRRLVPNDFHVELSATDLERLAPYDSAMATELTNTLRDHAEQQSYVFPGPVSIAFETAEDLTTGRFRIRSRAQAKVTSNPNVPPTGPSTGAVRRTRAVLEINGTRHPLPSSGAVVGRGTDADIRINDPGISRRHIEFRVGERQDGLPQLAVRDLGSTNGMLVDGAKVAQSPLDDGSSVKIGNTTMTVRFVTDGEAGGV
ncbi:FhaA domain-containing protein [Nocardioides pacificus]